MKKNNIIATVVVVAILVITGIVLAVYFGTSKEQPDESNTKSSGKTILVDSSGWQELNSTDWSIIENKGTNTQDKLNEIFELQKENEFGSERFAILLKPGIYNLTFNVGYYTTVLGLGKLPSDVRIIGSIQSLSQSPGQDSPGFLNRFWRGCENLQVEPISTMLWGVSQASHLRSVNVKGTLALATYPGFSSGGFMSDCQIDNDVKMETQQQFFIRNCSFKQMSGGAWNIVNMATQGTLPPKLQCVQNEILYSKIDKCPIIAKKPTLIYKDDKYFIQKYKVFQDSTTVLPDDHILIPQTDIFVANPSTSISKINDALSTGKNLLLMPGVYSLNEPIRITKNDTVVLGIGLATLQPVNGTSALIVENNIYGVRLAGFMIQAGNNQSSYLLQIGTSKHNGQPTNPIILSDVYCRVGGPNNKEHATTMIIVNQSHTILDGNWLWRADHNNEGEWSGLGPINAQNDHCLIVEGDNVLTYGLHCEHSLKELVLWNGDNGKMYFFQSELAYDVPSSWNYPGIRVGSNVNNFYGLGIGVYSYFANKFMVDGKQPIVSSAIIVPEKPNIIIESAMTILLNKDAGGGEITHVINQNCGASTKENASKPQWCSFNSSFCNS